MKKILSLDLEFNQPSGRIIQIGAAVGSLETLKVEASVSLLVKPGEALAEDIIKLTGIREEDVANEGLSLNEAFARFKDFAHQYDRVLNPVTWGGADGEELRLQLGHSLEGWLFGRRWLDVKTLHAAQCLAAGSEPRGGLARSMVQYGLYFEGRKHNARDDAINTLRLFLEMTRRVRTNLPGIGKLSA
jgi:inhibitor of KinA sporulation pathway (predicted exonuclease)